MYTIIVRDFLRWHFLAILQKNLNFVLESVFFNVIFFHQKIMKFQWQCFVQIDLDKITLSSINHCLNNFNKLSFGLFL
jgi:hypothetical protein